MKAKSLYGYVMLSFVLFAASVVADEKNENYCEEEHIMLLQVVEKELPDEAPLFLTERDDLNNELINLQVDTKSSANNRSIKVMRIRIFDISKNGNRVKDGRFIYAAVEMDADHLWRIGYDCKTKKIFHLYGFDDSTQGFNDLIELLDLSIGNSNHAFGVYYSYVKLLYREGFRQVIRNRLDLIQTALDNYDGHADEKAFDSYLAKITENVRQRILNPSAIPSAKYFKVNFVSSVDGTIKTESILIDDCGKIKAVDSKTIYKWPAPKQDTNR